MHDCTLIEFHASMFFRALSLDEIQRRFEKEEAAAAAAAREEWIA